MAIHLYYYQIHFHRNDSVDFCLHAWLCPFLRKQTWLWLLWPSPWFVKKSSTSPNPSCPWVSPLWSRNLPNPNPACFHSWTRWLTRSGCALCLPTSASASSCSLSVDSAHTSGTPRTTRKEVSRRVPPKQQPPMVCSRARQQRSRTPTSRVLSRPMSLASSTPFGSHWGPSCSRAVIFHHGKNPRPQIVLHTYIHGALSLYFCLLVCKETLSVPPTYNIFLSATPTLQHAELLSSSTQLGFVYWDLVQCQSLVIQSNDKSLMKERQQREFMMWSCCRVLRFHFSCLQILPVVV